MPASQLFSGTGSPNGAVTGNPGDVYQDETGKLWSKTTGLGTNTGWTLVSPGVFIAGAGAGSAIQNNGSGNSAAGINALAENTSCSAGGDNSHAEGSSSIANGVNAHAEGLDTFASGDTSHAEGFGTTASGTRSHAEGSTTSATNTAAHAEGNATLASGLGSHSEGISTQALGDGSHAEGSNTIAIGTSAHAHGDSSSAARETQSARASGKFVNAGDSQTSVLIFRGSTPGLAPNESVELKYGSAASGELTLEDGKAYAIRVRAIGYAHDTNFAVFENTFAANQEGGVITIKPAPPHAIPIVAGTAGATTWTLTANTAAAPTRISFTFATGAGTTAAVRVAADIEFVEVTRS
jgi:hypothetical protein